MPVTCPAGMTYVTLAVPLETVGLVTVPPVVPRTVKATVPSLTVGPAVVTVAVSVTLWALVL